MYRRRDSNPYGHHWPREFKSLVSTSSTTPAEKLYSPYSRNCCTISICVLDCSPFSNVPHKWTIEIKWTNLIHKGFFCLCVISVRQRTYFNFVTVAGIEPTFCTYFLLPRQRWYLLFSTPTESFPNIKSFPYNQYRQVQYIWRYIVFFLYGHVFVGRPGLEPGLPVYRTGVLTD